MFLEVTEKYVNGRYFTVIYLVNGRIFSYLLFFQMELLCFTDVFLSIDLKIFAGNCPLTTSGVSLTFLAPGYQGEVGR